MEKLTDQGAGEDAARRADKLVIISVAISGLLFVLLGIPLILESVAPNSAYGFRTEKTLSNPALWYEANRASGWDMSIAGAVISFGSALLWGRRKRLTPGKSAWLAMGLFTFALLGALAHGIYIVNGL